MKKKILLFIISLFVGVLVLCFIFKRNNFYRLFSSNERFPLTDIRLGNINLKSKAVIYTNTFIKGNEFLIFFKNLNDSFPLQIILADDFQNQDILLFKGVAHAGENEICCFETPPTKGQYNLKFITEQKTIAIPFQVEEQLTSYRKFNLWGGGVIPYPQWSSLDAGLMTSLISNVFSYSSKELGKDFTVLLVNQDDNGAQFSISQRIVSNYKNLPFGNLVQTIANKENQALLQAHLIDDYTILDRQYEKKAVTLKIRTISKGISYIIFNKTYLQRDLLNRKYLLSVNLTCPEKLVDFYQPIADYIFSHIQLNSEL